MTRQQKDQLIAGACLLFALMIGFLAPKFISPRLAGDGLEYFTMLQSWFAHQSPDLRSPDLEAMDRQLPSGVPSRRWDGPYPGYCQADNGRWYSIHFWFYPLLALPVRIAQHIAGGNGFSAFFTTNIICFTLTIGYVIFFGSGSRTRRSFFLALAAIGPVIWFLPWAHPELFTWCCAVISLSLYGKKRFGWSAAAAALGSMQNPPLAILALLPLGSAIAQRQGRQVVNAVLGLIPVFIAPLFYLYHFGVPSLITHLGFARLSLISPACTWSVLADPHQGMLPHIPFLLVLAIGGAVRAIIRRNWPGIGLTAVIVTIVLLVQTAINWNNGTSGMMRYAIWMTPLLAWLAVGDLSSNRRWSRGLMVAGLLLQAGLLTTPHSRCHHLEPSPVAIWAMTHFPSLVHPEPEIFAERQIGRETDWQKKLPVGFVGSEGSLLKILTDQRSLDILERRFDLHRDEMVGQLHQVDYKTTKLFYYHPPPGTIPVVEPIGWGQRALDNQVHWQLMDPPGAILSPTPVFDLEVTNKASYRFWGDFSGSRHPLAFICHTREAEKLLRTDRVHTPFSLAPGESVIVPVRLNLPRRRGTFDIELLASLDNLAWSQQRIRIRINVLGAGEQSYLARVTKIQD